MFLFRASSSLIGVVAWDDELTVISICRAGGVKLISGTRRITLDNTLDERLRLLEDRVRILLLSSTLLRL